MCVNVYTHFLFMHIDTYIYGGGRGEEVGGSGRNQHIFSTISLSYVND